MRSFRRGTSAVEFALMLPVIGFILAGVIDFGWYMQGRTVVVSASQEACRAAVLETCSGGAADSVADSQGVYAIGVSKIELNNVNVTTSGCPGTPPGPYTVTVAADFVPLVGLVPMPSQVVAQHTMLMEN